MKYVDKFSAIALNKILIKPWMDIYEISIIEEILLSLSPQRCLEYGAGMSTLYFPNFLSKGARWFSIEHDYDWAKRINFHLQLEPLFSIRGRGKFTEFYLRGQFSHIGSKTISPMIRTLKRRKYSSSVEVFHVPPNHFPWADEFGDGAYSDLASYIEFPSKFGYFDLILIDGRARKHCLIKSVEFLEQKGIVILHDAGREYYHEPFNLYKHQVLFNDPAEDESGLWLGSNGVDIESLLNAANTNRPFQYTSDKS